MPLLFAKPLAPLLVGAVVMSACGASISPRRPAAPTEEVAMSPTIEEVAPVSPTGSDADLLEPGTVDTDQRQRCIDTIQVLERRIDTEGFEFPDEEVELTEEELEQTMAPEVPFLDGVAAPDERPAIEPMGVFDPETAPILDLDHFRASCFEHGLVTEEEVYGPDEGDHEDWCIELAGIPVEDVREFAADEGDEVVREEFEACGLPNPLDP